MSRDGDTARVSSVKPLAFREPDHERPSSLVRQALAFAGRSAKNGHAWAGVAALAVVAAGLLGWRYLDASEQCDPVLVAYVLGMHVAGEREAAALEAAGEHATAEAIRRLVSVEHASDDVRLCVLLTNRLERGE